MRRITSPVSFSITRSVVRERFAFRSMADLIGSSQRCFFSSFSKSLSLQSRSSSAIGRPVSFQASRTTSQRSSDSLETFGEEAPRPDCGTIPARRALNFLVAAFWLSADPTGPAFEAWPVAWEIANDKAQARNSGESFSKTIVPERP